MKTVTTTAADSGAVRHTVYAESSDDVLAIATWHLGQPMSVAERLARMPAPSPIGRPDHDGRWVRSKERAWLEAHQAYQSAQADGTESLTLFRRMVTADAAYRRAVYLPRSAMRQYLPSKQGGVRDYRQPAGDNKRNERLRIKPTRVRGIRSWIQDAVLTAEEVVAVEHLATMRDELMKRSSTARFADEAYDAALARLRTKDGKTRLRPPVDDTHEARVEADSAACAFAACSIIHAMREKRHQAIKLGNGWSGRTVSLAEDAQYAAPDVVDGPQLLRWLADTKAETVARMGGVSAKSAKRAIKRAMKGLDDYSLSVE